MAGDGEGARGDRLELFRTTSAPLTPARSKAMHFMDTLARSKTLLAGWLRGLLDAHRRKVEHEKDFYRSLATYCRTNNVSPVCEDDWKTAAYIRNDDNPP
jgi:hypothetical protein